MDGESDLTIITFSDADYFHGLITTSSSTVTYDGISRMKINIIVWLDLIHQVFYAIIAASAYLIRPLAWIIPEVLQAPFVILRESFAPAAQRLLPKIDTLVRSSPKLMQVLSSPYVGIFVMCIYSLSKVTALARATRPIEPQRGWHIAFRLLAILVLSIGLCVSAGLVAQQPRLVPLAECGYSIGVITTALGVSSVVDSVIASIARRGMWLGQGPELIRFWGLLQSTSLRAMSMAKANDKSINNQSLFDALVGDDYNELKGIWPPSHGVFEITSLMIIIHIFCHAVKIVPGLYPEKRLYLSSFTLLIYMLYFCYFLGLPSQQRDPMVLGLLSTSWGEIIFSALIALCSMCLYGLSAILAGDRELLVAYHHPLPSWRASGDISKLIFELCYRSIATSANSEFLAERETLVQQRDTWLGPPRPDSMVDDSELIVDPYSIETPLNLPSLKTHEADETETITPPLWGFARMVMLYIKCLLSRFVARWYNLSPEERREGQIQQARKIIASVQDKLHDKVTSPRYQRGSGVHSESVHVAVSDLSDPSSDWDPCMSESDYSDFTDAGGASAYNSEFEDAGEGLSDSEKVACAETLMEAAREGNLEAVIAHLESPVPLTRRKFSLSRRSIPVERAKLEVVIAQRRRNVRSESSGNCSDTGFSSSTTASQACIICLDAPRTIICWPCRCLALCDECRVSLTSQSSSLCVSCRQPVRSYSRIYRP